MKCNIHGDVCQTLRGYELPQLIEIHGHFYFTPYSHLPGPFILKRSPAKTLATKKCARKVAKQDTNPRRRVKHTGAAGFLFFCQTKCTYQRNRTPQRGEMCCSSSPPRLYLCLYFPRTVLRGLRRKCHRFQQWPSSPFGVVALHSARLIRPCCPECRLLLSSGRLGIEPSSQTLLRMTALG